MTRFPAVCFYSARVRRSRGVSWSSFSPARTGEADVVYLFPDLSQAGDAHYQRFGPPRDSVIRLFYVGATRARETLYICQRESALAISI